MAQARFLKYWGALILVVAGLMDHPAYGADSFCVQTFNTFGPIYAKYKSLRYRLFADYIHDNPCEILALQEVWTNGLYETLDRSLSKNQHGVNFNKVIPTGTLESPMHVGLATFSSAPVSDVVSYLFPVNFDLDYTPLGALEYIRKLADTRKTVSVLRTQVNGSDIYIVNIHLHPHSQKVRVAQVISIIGIIENLLESDLPIVLAGDFNAEPNSLEMRLLHYVLNAKDSLDWSSACTYCVSNPNYIGLDFNNRRIDYILGVPSATYEINFVSSEIAPKKRYGFHLSDHFGIRSQVEISKGREFVQIDEFDIRKESARRALMETLSILWAEYDNPEFRLIYRQAFDLYTRTKLLEDTDKIAERISRR